MITSLGGLIAHDPGKARAKLEKLLEEHDGDPVAVASELRVSRRQLDRWLTRLGLLERKAEIREKVKGKGDPP